MASGTDPRPERLRQLRRELGGLNLDVFLVPVADAHQGYPLADHDQRLAWLSGFSGSAGLGAVGASEAALFVDGRYTIQARSEVQADDFTILQFKTNSIRKWLGDLLPEGGRIGIDPWLHSNRWVEQLASALPNCEIVCVDNLVDRIWDDQPPPPQSEIFDHELKFAGQPREAKIENLVRTLTETRTDAVILTSAESIAWLLNIRGSDIACTPVKHAFAAITRSGAVTLCVDLPDEGRARRAWLGEHVRLRPLREFRQIVAGLTGRVLVPDTAAHWAALALSEPRAQIVGGQDPCEIPKARKNSVQIDGSVQSHLRDGVAMAEFLAWLDAETETASVTELEAAEKLKEFRQGSGCLHDVSFDTISAAGPNGAIVHYRVTPHTNRSLRNRELYLVDSGGQYPDGTTDVTRTVPIGPVSENHIRAYSLVLRGLIALSSARWPDDCKGRDLDAIARQHLWRDQIDYSHGTGHGVGHFLSVHEGPASISRGCDVRLEESMVLSIEPGCYVSGEFGIRLENLAVISGCQAQSQDQEQRFLEFRTLTMVPFDRRLIDPALLDNSEIQWLDSYHAGVRSAVCGRCSPPARRWLEAACAPLRRPPGRDRRFNRL